MDWFEGGENGRRIRDLRVFLQSVVENFVVCRISSHAFIMRNAHDMHDRPYVSCIS
jgi:hypothetical protein